MAAATNGSYVYVRGGDHNTSDSHLVTQHPGSPSEPITITNFPGEVALFCMWETGTSVMDIRHSNYRIESHPDGGSITLSGRCPEFSDLIDGYVIFSQDSENILLKGLTFIRTSGYLAPFIWLDSTYSFDGIEIVECVFDGLTDVYQYAGIEVGNAATTAGAVFADGMRVRIHNNLFFRVHDHAVSVYGGQGYVSIKGNRLESSFFDNPFEPWFYAMVEVVETSDVVIANNVFYGIGLAGDGSRSSAISIQVDGDIGVISNIVISSNLFVHDGFVNNPLGRCVFVENSAGPGLLVDPLENLVIRNNLVSGDACAYFFEEEVNGGCASGCTIAFNTMTDRDPSRFGGDSSDIGTFDRENLVRTPFSVCPFVGEWPAVPTECVAGEFDAAFDPDEGIRGISRSSGDAYCQGPYQFSPTEPNDAFCAMADGVEGRKSQFGPLAAAVSALVFCLVFC